MGHNGDARLHYARTHVQANGLTTLALLLLPTASVVSAVAFSMYLVASSSQVFSPGKTFASTTNPALGIELSLAMNATTIASGQAIGIWATVANVLPSPNNVSQASNWPLPASELRPPISCPPSEGIYSQVFRGYYTTSNISSGGTPLQILPPKLLCIVWTAPYILQPLGFFVHQPLGQEYSAALSFYYAPEGTFPSSFNNTPPGSLVSSTLPFPSGVYTVAGDDEWGQLVILHFTVVSH